MDSIVTIENIEACIKQAKSYHSQMCNEQGSEFEQILKIWASVQGQFSLNYGEVL